MYQVKRGMGDSAVPSTGVFNLGASQIAHCASAWFYFDPICWATGYSRSAFQEMAQYQPLQSDLPVAPAAIPSAYSSVAPTVDQASQETSDALNAAMTQTQANTLASSQNQATVCGSGQTLADDGATCVSAGTNWALWGGIALVGLFALVAMGGGSARRYGR